MLACGILAATISGCALPPTSALDLEGNRCDPLAQSTGKATVLIFVSNDCPIANRYVPEILRLRDTYSPRGVNFWLVHADPHETVAEIRRHAQQFNISIPELRDAKHRLTVVAQAKVTPSAAVFAPDGRLVYHGRIDDRVADLQRERPVPTRRDLALALDAVLEGRPVAEPVTEAVGCFIPAAR